MRASRPLPLPVPGRRPAGGLLVAAAVAVAAAAASPPATAHQGRAAPRASKLFLVPSGSMMPTIPLGAYIRVELYGRPERARPAVGTIVVLHPPRGATTMPEDDEDGFSRCGDRRAYAQGRLCPRAWGGRSADRFVERIVAGPGDTVALSRGRVVRNGVPVDEPYAATACDHDAFPCTARQPLRLGRNRYFLLGDNRDESNDSRFWGPVPRAWLIGKVTEIDVPAKPMIPSPSR